MSHKIPVSVLVVIHSADLQVLLIERADKPGFWQSVTGSIDTLGEPLIATAARELFEETGIVASADADVSDACAGVADAARVVQVLDWRLSNTYEIFPVWRHRYAPGVTQNVEHVFSVCVPRDSVITLSPREHLRYAWMPYLEAADRCFSSSNAEAILQLPMRVTAAGA